MLDNSAPSRAIDHTSSRGGTMKLTVAARP